MNVTSEVRTARLEFEYFEFLAPKNKRMGEKEDQNQAKTHNQFKALQFKTRKI